MVLNKTNSEKQDYGKCDLLCIAYEHKGGEFNKTGKNLCSFIRSREQALESSTI